MRTFLPVVLVAIAACSGDGDGDPSLTGDTADTMPASLAIVGAWSDPYGTAHEIDDVTWTQTFGTYAPYVFHLASFDNEAGWVVAQNDSTNGYNADEWSRFDWTWQGDDLIFCQSVFDAVDEDAAIAAAGADASDQDTGCGGFPWTTLIQL